MAIVAGIDIGNSTTEVALAEVSGDGKTFLASALHPTTGLKGTVQNLRGIRLALEKAIEAVGWDRGDFGKVDLIRLNEAAPVIGDVAMETVTETVITESTMIGHNPSTPGGLGIGVGVTVAYDDLRNRANGESVVVVIPGSVDFEAASETVNEAVDKGLDVKALICQNDDGVLISNRLSRSLPIVDEVSAIDKIPLGMDSCVEVAGPGRVIEVLANPYDVATIFGLSPEETKQIVPVTRALVGNRSAVVIRTPMGEVKERSIPAGEISIDSLNGRKNVDVEAGAEAIMNLLSVCHPITDIFGQPGTNVGGMMERVRTTMAKLTGLSIAEIHIQDLLAVDTMVPQKVVGGLAGEFSQENGVALAVMVKTAKLPMQAVAEAVSEDIGIKVQIGGVEADMAIRGALTTPGTDRPIAILDLGAGSSDASFMKYDGSVELIHLAGAGNMVNTVICSELGIEDPELAESIKRYPLCKVESAYHVRQEDGTVRFFDRPLAPDLFGRVALAISDDILQPIPLRVSMEKVRMARRKAKKEVFVTNALRALEHVAPAGNVRMIDHVVLVGGSAKDFEIPTMITDALARYGVVSGRGNVRGLEGPRNAVATGLVLSYGGTS